MAYEEQFRRVERLYRRFELIDAGHPGGAGITGEDLLDDIHSFFQNCYHLKDWLKKDPAFSSRSGKSPAEIENFITNNRPLAICADICNATKHLGLDKSPRSGAEPKFGRRVYEATVGVENPTVAIKPTVEHDGQNLNAFTIATECMNLWRTFIT